jgi:hypothetical protein
MIEDGRMPSAKRLSDRRLAWDVRELDSAVDRLPTAKSAVYIGLRETTKIGYAGRIEVLRTRHGHRTVAGLSRECGRPVGDDLC